MANDTIFVRCTFCGQHKRLTKYYPSLGPHIDNVEKVAIPFFEWLNEHLKHHEHANNYEADLRGDPGFEFLTETGMASLAKEQGYINTSKGEWFGPDGKIMTRERWEAQG